MVLLLAALRRAAQPVASVLRRSLPGPGGTRGARMNHVVLTIYPKIIRGYVKVKTLWKGLLKIDRVGCLC